MEPITRVRAPTGFVTFSDTDSSLDSDFFPHDAAMSDTAAVAKKTLLVASFMSGPLWIGC
jgi:hypothetical protein